MHRRQPQGGTMELKDKPVLRLIQSKAADTAPRAPSRSDGSGVYYRRIKSYAERIRASEDVDTVIRLLESALSETAGLHRDQTVQLARDEVQRAERRIAALREELEQARRLIHIDHLTGALNRSGFDTLYAREAALADRHDLSFGIGLLDVDNFKNLNDVHGHQAGDAALVHLARVLKLALRPSDIVVRFGGEEFLVLLPRATLQRASRAVQRAQERLVTQVLVYNHRPLRFTFSAGVTERRPGELQADVIRRADHALYQAKKTGKQRVVPYVAAAVVPCK
jgi:diguanylate cyclase